MSFYGQDPYGFGGYGPPGYYSAYPAQFYTAGNAVYLPHRRQPKPQKEKDNVQIWCDVCGVGCIGQQNYAEHCSGKKHQMSEKKKSQASSPLLSAMDPPLTEDPSASSAMQSPSSVRFAPYDNAASANSPPISKGSQGKFYCELCGVYSTDQSTFNLHLAGKKHKLFLQKSGQPNMTDPYGPNNLPALSTSNVINLPRYHIQSTGTRAHFVHTLTSTPTNLADDNMLNSKLETLTPSTTDAMSLGQLVDAVTSKIAEFMEKEPEAEMEGNLPEATTLAKPLTVVETKIVGPYARGTMLKTNLIADVVVIGKEPPTFDALRMLKEVFENSIANITAEVGADLMDMYVRLPSGPAVHLLFTWLGAWEAGNRAQELPDSDSFSTNRPKLPTNENFPNTDSTDTNVVACQKALLLIRQVLWFSDNSLSPNVRQCIKIMKDLRHRNSVFTCLNNWALEVLVVNALRTLPLSASISQSLRAIFAFIASGMLLPGVDLLDPCVQTESVLQDLTDEQRLAITETAQKILNDIAFGRWDVIVE